MIRLFKTILITVCMYNALYAQQLNTPLLISGKVFNSAGQHIAKESLRFRVFLEEKPEFYIDQDAVSCGYNPPLWFAELGNLQTSWDFGDLLIIVLEDVNGRENARFKWSIDSTGHVPDIRTQILYSDNLISHFRLSDKGVFHNDPLKFTFNSVFTELPQIELKIYSANGQEVYKNNLPQIADFDTYQFVWDGRANNSQKLVSGLYYYFFKVNGKVFRSGIITLKNE